MLLVEDFGQFQNKNMEEQSGFAPRKPNTSIVEHTADIEEDLKFCHKTAENINA